MAAPTPRGSLVPTGAPLRPELQRPVPDRIARLPVDARGYPVPWFVEWLDTPDGGHAPEFRAMDRVKWVRAVRELRCWVCGEPLGRWRSFVVGPMCGVNRISSEPPSHLDCADWSARNCPFLSRPHMVRREDALINAATFAAQVPGIGSPRNPGVTLVWTTERYRVVRAPGGAGSTPGWLIEMGDPAHVRWYAEGLTATRAHVEAAVAAGLPALHALCDQDADPDASRQALAAQAARLVALYPAR